ncbi:MAG: ABC transporter substrate-binding protein [Anaerolineae bacterium]
MSDASQTSLNLTRRAILAYQSGHPETARELLAEAIQDDPQNELAWLWLAALAHSNHDKRYCLERALEINPKGPARDALVALGDVTPTVPTYVADADQLPRPAEIMDVQEKKSRVRYRRRRILVGVLAVAALVALVGLAAVRVRLPKEAIRVTMVAPVTGPSSEVGQELVQSARLAIDRMNEAGGINGRAVELVVYDDQNDPDLARQRAEEIVKDGRALAVLGHNSSAPTQVASEVYNAAGMPMITGTASADEVTKGMPWSFSTTFNNTAQGTFLATYVARILKAPRVSVVFSNEVYGQSLSQAFLHNLPLEVDVANIWTVDVSPDTRDESVKATIEAIVSAPDPGLVLLVVPRLEAKDLVLGVRRANPQLQIFVTDSAGSSAFADLFKDEPEEQQQPGFFTEGIYAATPLIYDSAPLAAQALAEQYQTTYDAVPSWRGVKIYNAALALFDAMRRADIRNTADGRADDRDRIRRNLGTLRSRESSVEGLDGPIYFNEDGAAATPVSVGVFQGRTLLSAPAQLRPAENLGRIDVPAALNDGDIFEVNGQYLRPTRVVYTGATINELSDLDARAGTAKLDFYLWFRYRGDDDVTNIAFINADDNGLTLGEPIEQATIDGMKYRLYRVRGNFRQDLDFHDYPFDRQKIGVRFQNAQLPRDEVIYVVDTTGMAHDGDVANAQGGRDFVNIDNWHLRGAVELFQTTIGQKSNFGDPRLFNTNSKLEFSEFSLSAELGRDLLSFLVRNLLPLALILIILYISLFFSHEDQTTDRVSTAVTVLLTAAVLLAAIYGSLPEVGYTVAIEYGFYGFFGLTLAAVFLALIGSRLYKQGHEEILDRIDLAARIIFPLVVLAFLVWYVVQYVPRLQM